MTKDPIEAMKEYLGCIIEAIEIDSLDEEVLIMTNKGTILFSGKGLEMTVDLDDYKQ